MADRDEALRVIECTALADRGSPAVALTRIDDATAIDFEPAVLVIGATADEIRAALSSLREAGAEPDAWKWECVRCGESKLHGGSDPPEARTCRCPSPGHGDLRVTPLYALARSPGGTEGWRPIETAPKDGTKVLATDGTEVWACWWDAEFDWTFDDDRSVEDPEYSGHYEQHWTDGAVSDWGMEENCFYEPTHWMPLPAAPTEDRPEGDANDLHPDLRAPGL